MNHKLETREERLGRLRAWARGPYRTVEVTGQARSENSKNGAVGITKIQTRTLEAQDLLPGKPGAITTFHSCLRRSSWKDRVRRRRAIS